MTGVFEPSGFKSLVMVLLREFERGMVSVTVKFKEKSSTFPG